MKAAVLTVSDSCARGERTDESGALLHQRLDESGWQVVESKVVPDEIEAIRSVLIAWADKLHVDVVVTTGGTGLSPRDLTPEATLGIIERRAAGIMEALRADGFRRTPRACLSRGEAGVRGQTLFINLPGSRRAVSEGMDFLLPLLPHALEMMRGGGH